MDRVIALSVLLLLLPTPHLCRRLSTDNFDNISHNGVPLESVERYGLLPTPNIASPLLTPPLIAPDQLSLPSLIYSQEPEIELLPAIHKPASNSVKLHKQYHKIPITKIYNDEGKHWTKFPNKKNLVEIVPLRHKTKKSKGKGKALAYILPKPKIVKKTLDNELNYLTDLSESSEENLSYSASFDKDSSESQNIYSVESNSLEYYEPKRHHNSAHHNKHLAEYKGGAEYSKDMVNNKINDLVEYLKEHSNGTVDKLIHDVVPDVEDPDLHVHYIIHKKRSPHKHGHGLTDNDVFTQQGVHTYPTYESPIVIENIRHNVPNNNVISSVTSDEQHSNYGHNTHVASNHLHPHHHKKIHSLENTDSHNIHYIVENTDHGPILLPNVIHEDVKSFPEIIVHPPRLPDAHDVQHTIAESNTVPEYAPDIPQYNILEPGHNNYIFSNHPEVHSHSHSLVDHISPDIEYNSIDSYLVESKDPEGEGGINERLIKSNEVYQSPIHIYLEDINESYIKDPSNSVSDSSKIDSIEDSVSSGNDESSEEKISYYPAAIDLKQNESADNSMSSFSDSSSTSDELETNANSFEESTGIEDTIPTMIPTQEELLSVFPSNIDDTFETTSSSQEESVKQVIEGNENEIHINAVDGKNKTHDCNKLNKTRNSNKRNIYKLTFLFNR